MLTDGNVKRVKKLIDTSLSDDEEDVEMVDTAPSLDPILLELDLCMIDNLLPFLDVWDVYNFRRVSKQTNYLCKHYNYSHYIGKIPTRLKIPRNCSMLTLHFAREGVCCVCFKKINFLANLDIGTKMYCHKKCTPKLQAFRFNTPGVPIAVNGKVEPMDPGVTYTAAYPYYNPCFSTDVVYVDKLWTIKYLGHFIHKDVNALIWNKYNNYFASYNKLEIVKRHYDIETCVNFGRRRENVYKFYTLYRPLDELTLGALDFVDALKNLQDQLTTLNSRYNKFFKNDIVPKLLHGRLEFRHWAAFLKIGFFKDSNVDIVDEFMKYDKVLLKAEEVEKMMVDILEDVNFKSLSDSIVYKLGALARQLGCPCTQCRRGGLYKIKALLTRTDAEEFIKKSGINLTDVSAMKKMVAHVADHYLWCLKLGSKVISSTFIQFQIINCYKSNHLNIGQLLMRRIFTLESYPPSAEEATVRARTLSKILSRVYFKDVEDEIKDLTIPLCEETFVQRGRENASHRIHCFCGRTKADGGETCRQCVYL